MVDVGFFVGLAVTAFGGAAAYGKLSQRVADLGEDIKRLDGRIVDLTNFLLQEARGEPEVNK